MSETNYVSKWSDKEDEILRKFPGDINAAFDALEFMGYKRTGDAIAGRMRKLGVYATPALASRPQEQASQTVQQGIADFIVELEEKVARLGAKQISASVFAIDVAAKLKKILALQASQPPEAQPSAYDFAQRAWNSGFKAGEGSMAEKAGQFRHRAATILCETRGHNGARPCDFCLNVTLFEPALAGAATTTSKQPARNVTIYFPEVPTQGDNEAEIRSS